MAGSSERMINPCGHRAITQICGLILELPLIASISHPRDLGTVR